MKPEDFDVIGLTVEEAQAKYPTWRFRAKEVDGIPRVVTMDFRRDRVNIALKDGKIISVKSLG